ncbi:MAG: bifunctional heptose 7-phosphate kinase/heptose 1-phosphate adenyltransferase [Anaerolineae bacterium]
MQIISSLSGMNEGRLRKLLARFPEIHVLVVGDFFLDQYLIIDRRLSEVSLETGLEAYQVVEVRCSPGAAGTVTSNLRSLGVHVTALGVIGNDGPGYELRGNLVERGVNIESLIVRDDLFTPTYTKPLMREPDGRQHEIQRLDIKNRAPLPEEVEQAVISRLREFVPHVQGVIIADQVQERNCGVITDRVREEVIALAQAYSDKVLAVDSRERIGLFRDVIIKPNRREAVRAVYPDREADADETLLEACGAALHRRTGRPVFLTIGAEGILLFDAEGHRHIPAVRVGGPIDIVGAGDSVMAGLVSALCAGAEPAEAALVGNLAASITIQQIGTTGTASCRQVLERFRELNAMSASAQRRPSSA